jgi:hypothetical protein
VYEHCTYTSNSIISGKIIDLTELHHPLHPYLAFLANSMSLHDALSNPAFYCQDKTCQIARSCPSRGLDILHENHLRQAARTPGFQGNLAFFHNPVVFATSACRAQEKRPFGPSSFTNCKLTQAQLRAMALTSFVRRIHPLPKVEK